MGLSKPGASALEFHKGFCCFPDEKGHKVRSTGILKFSITRTSSSDVLWGDFAVLLLHLTIISLKMCDTAPSCRIRFEF